MLALALLFVAAALPAQAQAAKKISRATISGVEQTYAYTGSKVKPKPTLTFKKQKLKRNVDYTLEWKSAKKIGTATLTIRGIGNFKGKVTLNYKIRYSLAEGGTLKLARRAFAYTGEKIKPTLTVKYDGRKLTQGTDYKVAYTNAKKVGTATVTVTGKGEYAFSLSKTYTIEEGGGLIADLSEWNTVTNWTKVAAAVDGVILRSWVEYSSESGWRADNKYDEYATGCEEVGLAYGAYGYFNFTSKSAAKKQAKAFFEASFSNGHAPLYVALDLEDSNMVSAGTKVAKWTVAAMEVLQECYEEAGFAGTLKIGLYIANHRYSTFGFTTATGLACAADAAFVWIPTYGTNTGSVPTKYSPNYAYDLWQYTSKGSVAGISGNVDLSIVNNNGPHALTLSFFLTRTTLDDEEEPVEEEADVQEIEDEA